MERSLLFFYSIGGIALIAFAIKFVKAKSKWQNLTPIFSVIISCTIASSFPSLSAGMWFALVAMNTFNILFIVVFLMAIFKRYLIIRYFNKITKELKVLPPSDLIDYLIKDHNKYQWYALHLPLEGSFEIAVNVLDTNPVIGKKFHIKTLAGRQIHFTPEYIPQTIDFETNFICVLQEFYEMAPHAKLLVDDYILRIKSGHQEPWTINLNDESRNHK